MKLLLSKEVDAKGNNKEAILLAETEDDIKCLDFLYHSSVIFGSYLFYNAITDTNKTGPTAKIMQKYFPNATGLLRINLVKGFAYGQGKTVS